MTVWRDTNFRLGAAAFLLLLVSLGVPAISLQRPIYNVIAVLDITGSMNVPDQVLDGAPASRLAMEKRAVRKLLASLPCGSRLGLAIFVEARPFLLFEPVETCANFTPLDQEISLIDWRMAWDSESHIAAGLRNAMEMARSLNADLIFMTDGQETPPLWWTGAPKFDALRNTTHGLIAGIGAKKLSPIPKFDFAGRQIGTWKPGEVPSETSGIFRGREHLSAVDEPHLQSLAVQTGLAYRHVTGPNDLMSALARAVPRHTREITMKIRWLPAAAALMFLAVAGLGKDWGRRAVPPQTPHHCLGSSPDFEPLSFKISLRPSRKLGYRQEIPSAALVFAFPTFRFSARNSAPSRSSLPTPARTQPPAALRPQAKPLPPPVLRRFPQVHHRRNSAPLRPLVDAPSPPQHPPRYRPGVSARIDAQL